MLFASLSGNLLAEDAKPIPILFANAHVFDRSCEQRIENANVLDEVNLYKQVSTEEIAASEDTVIDGGERTSCNIRH